ncbi:flagellar hook-basal body protein [Planococcus lenghuensis]|uniref:Flagellar biosynthesis protein FlgG n=1 Tax=Planococcus lenghuensis TaxID=2213202 RepID=A0A1Q2L268_9BACL|nr:flagellar hook-basal body protein [Planococcus lenghuensis]AQQ54137.1 flagellar biosynthesis protein FlgG [Planococcus lenghuensis]
MFRGLYIATSGLMAHNRKQQVLTNNLANANTPGFKQDETVLRAFPAQLIQAMQAGKHPATIGKLHTGVYAQEGIPSFVQGALKETGNPTDISLLSGALPVDPETQQQGTLLFAVNAGDGQIRYTQNGQFAVDQDGFLTTADGLNVLDANFQTIRTDSENFTVQGNGEIIREDGTNANQLWVGYTNDPEQLVKEGHNLLRWEGDFENAPLGIEAAGLPNMPGDFVKQGMVEQSNVDLTRTMTDMMSTYRSFESSQKVIQAYDRSMEKAVNEIGRV